MGTASSELINMLTEFLICEIGSKSVDGITYALFLNADTQKEAFKKYSSILTEAKNCGYSASEIFRIFQVSNGYILDMDMKVCKKIVYEIAKGVSKTDGGTTPNIDMICDKLDKRRKSDMFGLAKYVKSEYDKGNRIIEVALFSRNSTPRIQVTGIGPKNEMLTLIYNAYAIRHWDIEVINSELLIPAGIRIAKLQPCEIVPARTGVKFKLFLEKAEV